MAGFERQIKSAQTLNRALQGIGESSRSWSNNLSQAYQRLLETQKESVDQAKELELAQQKMEQMLTSEEAKRKSINKILEKQGTYYKSGLNYLKAWEQRLKVLEKETDSMLKKATFHFTALGTKVLRKVGESINNIFSLKGALKLLKVGIGTALGIFAGLVTTVKSVGSLVYKHLSGAFKLVSSVVRTSAGLVMSFFRKIWDTITMGGGEIRQAVAEMAQAFGLFNNTFGQAMNFLQANRRDWRQMGLSIGEATKYVIELNRAYGKVIGFGNAAKKFYVENIKMARALGLEATQAAKFSKQLSLSGKTLKDFTFNLVGTFGPGGPLESMGVMIPEVARDISESTDQLAYLGEQGRDTFIAGAVWVRQYGFAIKDLTGMMDKFDTFSSAAQNVSKLNQMFGVTINALEMLTETDPAARLEKVQKQLLQAGKSWESMDYFQRKALSSMMGLTGEQAQLVFTGKQLGKSRQEIAKAMEAEDKKQANSQKRQAEVMSAILAQLRASRGIMGSIMPLFYRLWVAFGRVFKTFLWGARRGALDFVEGWADGIRKLAASPVWKQMSKNWVVRWRDTMKNFGVEWGKLWSQIDMRRFGEDFYGTIDEAIRAVRKILVDLFPDWAKSAEQGAGAINDIIHGIAVRLQGIIKWVGENGADIIRGIGRVAKGTWSIVSKVFNFFDKSNWGEAAKIMKGLFETISKDAASILGYVDKTTGKMLTGFDPAVGMAKLIEKSYMSIRDISIEIYDWWKRNGDEIKGTLKEVYSTVKPIFNFMLQTGKYVGSVLKTLMEFLAKNPAILKIVAGAKAASFVTEKLFGMGLSQIAGGLLQSAKGGVGIGVQKVYVMNAAEIGAAAATGGIGAAGAAIGPQTKWGSRWTAAKNIGGKVLTGAGRGLAGGAIGYGLGTAAGALTGVPELGGVGAGIGAGAGIGSMLGPVGTIIGGAVGGLVGGITSFIGSIDEARERIRQKISQDAVNYIEKHSKAMMRNINSYLQQKSAVEMFTEALVDASEVTQREISSRRNEIDTINEQTRIDKERRQLNVIEMKDQLKRMRGRTAEEIEAKNQLRAKLSAEEAEIKARRDLNKILDESIEYQDYLKVLQKIELDQRTLELDARGRNLGAEQANEELNKRLVEAKENETKAAEKLFSRLENVPENLAQMLGVFSSLTREIKQLDLPPMLAGELTDQIRRVQAEVAENLSPEDTKKQMEKLYADIGESVRGAIDTGNFGKAMLIQAQIDANNEILQKNRLTVQSYELQVLGLQLQASKIRAEAEAVGTAEAAESARKKLEGLDVPPLPSLSAYAFGGLVRKATAALVGEAGPELIMPMKRGPVNNAPGTESVIQDYLKRINPSKRSEERVVVIPINIDGKRLGSGLVRIAHRSI